MGAIATTFAEDAIFDYDLVKEDAESLEVQVAAIPKDVIDNYLSIFHAPDPEI